MSKYKLVPVEPTPEMVGAAREHHEGEAYLPVSLYKAMLATAPAVQGEPPVRKLGIMGAAFDPPSVRRAYTYSDQPDNTTAWKLGRSACKERSGGDLIDYGLQMLRYLQDEGFGVFEINEADPAPQPAVQQPDVTQLVEVLTELCDEIDKHEIHAAISKTSISWFKRKARAALAAHRKGGDA